jgi:hypothetical protein
MSALQHLAPQALFHLPCAMIYIDLLTSIQLVFAIVHLVFVGGHILQAMTAPPLTIAIIFAFAAGSELIICGFDALA